MENKKKPVRVWVDGCFDMMHFGHANALRQARSLGDYLIVGVHSDADIVAHKGPPVMNEQERYLAVRACKWADEVVEAAPYTTQLSYLEKYNVDFVVHGDDVVLNSNGEDCYAEVKAAGKFKTVPRTQGVSTTDLVGRMLLLSKDHHRKGVDNKILHETTASPYTRVSHFVPSTRKITQFSEGCPERTKQDHVVYVDGGFDLFHVGHIEFLRVARELGSYLVVGVHSDEDVHQHKGENYPIMTLQERVLGVLSCRYVSEVIIGAPYAITQEMIESLSINTVCAGSYGCSDPADSYAVAKKLGIFKQLQSPSNLTSTDVVKRILANYKDYAKRNKKKEEREVAGIGKGQQEGGESEQKKSKK